MSLLCAMFLLVIVCPRAYDGNHNIHARAKYKWQVHKSVTERSYVTSVTNSRTRPLPSPHAAPDHLGECWVTHSTSLRVLPNNKQAKSRCKVSSCRDVLVGRCHIGVSSPSSR